MYILCGRDLSISHLLDTQMVYSKWLEKNKGGCHSGVILICMLIQDSRLQLKSAYAITRLRKATGYSKKLFYQHAIRLYKEINTLLADGDVRSLRKAVTEKMYSTLKNELKRRETMWSRVYWELVEPVVSTQTLWAQMIAIDKDNLDKAFI